MKWGRKWGNKWGVDSINSNLLTIVDYENTPPEALVKWTSQGSGILYHVYVDGKLYGKTTALEMLVQFKNIGRHWVEVMLGSVSSKDEDLSAFITAIPGSRVNLSWTASTSDDVAYYAIYYDEGLGGALSYLDRTKAGETEWISLELDNGTYVFRVDAVDEAGNRVTSGSTVSVTIAKYPNAPADIALDSYDANTQTATFSFTASSTPPSVTGYHVYHNSGSGDIDYTSIQATVAYGNTSFTLILGVGEWIVGIRAYNASYEEDNVDVYTEFEIAGSPVDLMDEQPNIPLAIEAIPASGGTFTMRCTYDAFDEKAKATQINFYANNGLGGAVNYASTIATAIVDDHTTGEQSILAIEATSSALVDGRTYTFACKAQTATGRESDTSDTTIGLCDATAPADISSLDGEAVNYEE